jgi:hypothetical protein
MKFFGKPDIEQMRRDGDIAGLVHWADFRRDPEVSRAAVVALREKVLAVVQHLYDTAVWAEAHKGPGRRGLPPRGVYLLKETTSALRKVGRRAVEPLADSVRMYGVYGDPDENVRFLYFALVFDVLLRIGRPSADELRDLARSKDADVRKHAREALTKLEERGQLDDFEDLDDGTG